MGRVDREKRTVRAMISMYCRDRHGGRERAGDGAGLCRECADLGEYARRRVDRCRFGEDKPTCARCTVHCFKPEMRERIREVMRYAGPRMPLRHPCLALMHFWDGRNP